MGILSRFRFELLALALVAAFGALHLATGLRPPEGLEVVGGTQPSFLARAVGLLEGPATDLKFRIRGERAPHPDVVVLALDERGVQRWGRWPWPREVMARTFEALIDSDVKVIGFDGVFSDQVPDPVAPARELRARLNALQDPGPQVAALQAALGALPPDGDQLLHAALEKAGARLVLGVIPYAERDVGPLGPDTVKQHLAALDARVIRTVHFGSTEAQLEFDHLPLWTQYAAQTSLPQLTAPENRFGHFSMITDVDGIIRRMAVLSRLTAARGLLPSLALQTAASALHATIEPARDVSDGFVIGAALKPEQGAPVLVPFQGSAPYLLIDYPGTSAVYPTVSVVDLLDGAVQRSRLAGKVVLVGNTIVGSNGDQRASPFKVEPGVYTHAAVVSNILSGDFLTRPAPVLLVELLAMLAVALAFARLVPRLKAFRWKAAVIVGVIGGWLAADLLAFGHGLLLATVVPLASNVTVAVAMIFLGYLSVDREKLKMRSTFSRYLGEDVMDAALQSPERLNRGEKREMTVLFSDIRGFTSLSERMSPEALASFINEYLSPMTRIVFDEKGTLDKYIGDAVMAFWNAPLDQPDHALRACRAAVAMLEKLAELKGQWRRRGYPELEIGVGINTGPMVVGNMGSDVRVDYTVLGDAVNLASRLEGTNKEYETRIIISESTWGQVKGQVIGRRLGAVRVKGKRQPVGIFELRGLGAAAGPDAEAIAAFEQALEAWAGRDFAGAKARFERVLALWPGDPPARHYLVAVEGYLAHPPAADWDGVISLATK